MFAKLYLYISRKSPLTIRLKMLRIYIGMGVRYKIKHPPGQ